MSAVLADVNTQDTLDRVSAIEMFDLLSFVCSKLRLGAIFHKSGRARVRHLGLIIVLSPFSARSSSFVLQHFITEPLTFNTLEALLHTQYLLYSEIRPVL